MVQLNIVYPKKENSTFDWDYYLNTHMPLSIKLHGPALKRVSIVKGLDMTGAGVPVSYIAITNLFFESVNSFLVAFMPHAATLQEDIKNYTNIEPIIQFSEEVLRNP